MRPGFSSQSIDMAASQNSQDDVDDHQQASTSAFHRWDRASSSASASTSGRQAPPRRRSSGSTVARMTVSLVQTYRQSNPKYAYTQSANPRRALTKPSEGTKNDGHDNDDNDLIMHVNDVLLNSQPANGIERQYVVEEMLGQGTFGQVAACWSDYFRKSVAVKVIKNQPAYYHQARVEIGLLQLLNTRCDPSDQHRIVRMLDFFLYRKHLCLVFEKLDVNLFELLKRNSFRGLSLTLVQLFLRQILDALTVLRDASIIHCDIKPENILLKSAASGDLKLIDFGSACFEGRTVYSYIQSRFYRSPEVVLGHTYTVAIDMWSFGCVAAELFLGLPLFPGASEHDLMARVDETLGNPPDWLLRCAKHTDKFYNKVPHPSTPPNGTANSSRNPVRYVRMGAAEFEARNGCKAPAGKRYFPHTTLADIIGAYPVKQGLSDDEVARERHMRESFIDFLIGVLDTDPTARWTPRQARCHPFITGAAFTGPHQPSPDTYRPALLPNHAAAPPSSSSSSGQPSSRPRHIPAAGTNHGQQQSPSSATAGAIASSYQQQQQQHHHGGGSNAASTAGAIAASYQQSHHHPSSAAMATSYQQQQQQHPSPAAVAMAASYQSHPTIPSTAAAMATSYQAHQMPSGGALAASYQASPAAAAMAASYQSHHPSTAGSLAASYQSGFVLPGTSRQQPAVTPACQASATQQQHKLGVGGRSAGVTAAAGGHLYDGSSGVPIVSAQQAQQAHEQAHAIAMAAIHSLQNSPQFGFLGSSVPTSHMSVMQAGMAAMHNSNSNNNNNSSATARAAGAGGGRAAVGGAPGGSTVMGGGGGTAPMAMQQQQPPPPAASNSWQGVGPDPRMQGAIPLGSTPSMAVLMGQRGGQAHPGAVAAAGPATRGVPAAAAPPPPFSASQSSAAAVAPPAQAAVAPASAAARTVTDRAKPFVAQAVATAGATPATAATASAAVPVAQGGLSRRISQDMAGPMNTPSQRQQPQQQLQPPPAGHSWESSAMDASAPSVASSSSASHQSPALNYLAASYQAPSRFMPSAGGGGAFQHGGAQAGGTAMHGGAQGRQWQQQQPGVGLGYTGGVGQSYVAAGSSGMAAAGAAAATFLTHQQQQQPHQQQSPSAAVATAGQAPASSSHDQRHSQRLDAAGATAAESGSSTASEGAGLGRRDEQQHEDQDIELDDLFDDGDAAHALMYDDDEAGGTGGGGIAAAAGQRAGRMSKHDSADDLAGSSPGDWDPCYSDALLFSDDAAAAAAGGRQHQPPAGQLGGTQSGQQQQHDGVGVTSTTAAGVPQHHGGHHHHHHAHGGLQQVHLAEASGAPTISSWSHAPRVGMPFGYGGGGGMAHGGTAGHVGGGIGYGGVTAGQGIAAAAGFGFWPLPGAGHNMAPGAFAEHWRDGGGTIHMSPAVAGAGVGGSGMVPMVMQDGGVMQQQYQATSAPTGPFAISGGGPPHWGLPIQQQAQLQQQQQQTLFQQQAQLQQQQLLQQQQDTSMHE